MEFFSWLFWLLFGKRNSDLPSTNDSTASDDDLGEGLQFNSDDGDIKFWEDDYCCAIYRPSREAFIFLNTTLGTIDDVRFDNPTLKDAIDEFEFYVEIMGYEPYYNGSESSEIATGYTDETKRI